MPCRKRAGAAGEVPTVVLVFLSTDSVLKHPPLRSREFMADSNDGSSLFSDVMSFHEPRSPSWMSSPPHPMTALRFLDDLPKCVVCGVETLFVCSACDANIPYCTPTHCSAVSTIIFR